MSDVRVIEGALRFSIEINVSPGEMAGWDAKRIAAFFGGIAQVAAARDAVDLLQALKDERAKIDENIARMESLVRLAMAHGIDPSAVTAPAPEAAP